MYFWITKNFNAKTRSQKKAIDKKMMDNRSFILICQNNNTIINLFHS